MVKEKRKSFWSWKIDEADLKNQVENYRTLKIKESYKGISVLIVICLLGLGLLLAFFGVYATPSEVIWSLIIYIPILAFVYRGHRWAIIALMGLWTFEKIYQLYQIGEGGSGGGIMPIIWWLIIMPYFWKALRVENARKSGIQKPDEGPIENASTFCKHCGKSVDTDSKFCTKCGNKL